MNSILKLNIDGASKGNPRLAGCGGILRDSNGEMIMAFSEFLGWGSNNFAEISALLSGLLICYQIGVPKVLIESDSKLLVQWFLNECEPPWALLTIWRNILQISELRDISIQHIYRERNATADKLAKQGADGVKNQYFHRSSLPSDVLSCWSLDAL